MDENKKKKYIHYSEKPLLRVCRPQKKRAYALKPNGLWFSDNFVEALKNNKNSNDWNDWIDICFDWDDLDYREFVEEILNHVSYLQSRDNGLWRIVPKIG